MSINLRLQALAKETILLSWMNDYSFKESEKEFTLTSGIRSKYYVDCKNLFSIPMFRESLGRLVLTYLDGKIFDAIIGMELGGSQFAQIVSTILYTDYRESYPSLTIRKTQREHGTSKRIEGEVEGVKKVILVEDVLTTGKSLSEAVKVCEENNLQIEHAFVLVDRQELQRTHINFSCDYTAIYTLQDLIQAKHDLEK